MSWVWAHGTNLDQQYFPNNHYSTIAWEILTGTKPPTGTTIGSNQYAGTATGPYDQTVWGSNTLDQRSGWTNDNQLQVNYQRLFHNGIAYQVYYDWSKAFREGGNYFRDGTSIPRRITSPRVWGPTRRLPIRRRSPRPSCLRHGRPVSPPGRTGTALDRWADYFMDTSIPVQEIRFNFLVDLPFGRGKRYLTGANKALDEVVGGWQLASDGTMASQDFYVGNGNWGPNNPIKMYKTSKKITDCRSGTCQPVFLWFNGYIQPSQVSGTAASTCTTVVSGLPSDWKPYSSPLNTNYVPKAGSAAAQGRRTPTTTPTTLQVNLTGGGTDTQGFAPGTNGHHSLETHPGAGTEELHRRRLLVQGLPDHRVHAAALQLRPLQRL